MKLDAVGVTSKDINKTVEFYKLLGFSFPEISGDHIEAKGGEGSIRLMIDKEEIVEALIGEKPSPGNLSAFALSYDSPTEVDTVYQKVRAAGFKIVKEPWDAFWGQRYCVVEDPDGFRVDLYAAL